MWMGSSIHSGDRPFFVPDNYPLNASGSGVDKNGRRFIRVKGVRWFTNLDHGRRHEPLSLMTMGDNIKFSKHKQVRGKKYMHYDNFDAIEVPFTDAIPSDYDGIMGVPISFLDKYNPDQFKIVGRDGDLDLAKTYTFFTPPSEELANKYKKMNHTWRQQNVYFVINGKLKINYKRIFIKSIRG